MPPQNPKRPPRPGPPPDDGPVRRKPTTEVDLPFDTAEVTPLRVDDPRPQRVAQYPAGGARRPKPADQVPTEVMQIPAELTQGFGAKTQETQQPVFVYVERGPGAGQLVPLSQGALVIGRSSSSDLRLQHPSISRRHAELTRSGDRFFLKDLGSQNGTYVNKARLVAEREIFPGDTLALGTAILKLRGPMQAGGAELTGTHTHRRSGIPRLLLFGFAVVFGLASIGVYAVLRAPAEQVGPGRVPLNAPGPVAQAGPKGPIVPMPELRHAEEEPPRPDAVASQTRAEEPAGRPHASPKVPAATTRAKPKPIHATRPSRSVHVTKPAAKPRVEVAEVEPRAERPAPGDQGALDAYREGDLSAALQLAKGSVATKLQRFQTEYTAGRRALADHDAATATAHFRKALEVDRTLAGGEGTFSGILKHELAELKTLEAAEGSPPASHTPAPKKSQPAARDAIDAAFGD